MTDLDHELALAALAAVGMAAGGAAWGVAIATTAIVVISLWPLHEIERQIVRRRSRTPPSE